MLNTLTQILLSPGTLEAGMLCLFSASWYWSIHKMLKTKTAVGKSAMFVAIVCAGYMLGIASKLTIWEATGVLPMITFLYLWNLCVTAFDLFLVIHYSEKQETRREPAPAPAAVAGDDALAAA